MTVTLMCRTAPLWGALSGVLPHLPAKQSDNEVPLGIGVCRLVLVSDQLLALAVSKGKQRAVVTCASVVECDDDVVDVWLSKPALEALTSVLRQCTAVEVELTVSQDAIEVREVGVLWGGRSVRVRLDDEPRGSERVDAARVLLSGAQAQVLARASHGLWVPDAQAVGRTAKALGESLRVHAGLAGDSGVLVWGFGERREFDRHDQPYEVPGSRYLAVSSLPRSEGPLAAVDRTACYAGSLIPLLFDAQLPSIGDQDASSEGAESAFVREVESYVQRSQGLDGPYGGDAE